MADLMKFKEGVTVHPWGALSEAVGAGALGVVCGSSENEFGRYIDLEFEGYGSITGVPEEFLELAGSTE